MNEIRTETQYHPHPPSIPATWRRRRFGLRGINGIIRRGAAIRGREPAKKAVGKTLNLGVASYTFRAFDLDKTFALTKRAGLKNICLKSMHLPLDAKPEELAAIAAKVAAAGLTLYGGGVIDMSKEAQITQAFEYGKAAGLRVLVISPDPAMLPLIEQHVKKYDISVAIHNHGPGDRRFPTPQSVYEKIASLDRRVGLCIDIGHTVRAGVDLVAAVNKCHDRLLDMHVKDVTEATAKGQCIQLGRGVIDIPGLLRALVNVGYQGHGVLRVRGGRKRPVARPVRVRRLYQGRAGNAIIVVMETTAIPVRSLPPAPPMNASSAATCACSAGNWPAWSASTAPASCSIWRTVSCSWPSSGARATRRPLAAMEQRLAGLDVYQLQQLVRMEGCYLELMNLAEDRHRARVLRQRDDAAFPAPRGESIGAAVDALCAAGVSPQQMQELLDKLDICPVFTAHPTEAKRVTLRCVLGRMRETLQDRSIAAILLRRQREDLLQRLQGDLMCFWETETVRPLKPSVLDEVARTLYVAGTLWQVVPQLFRDLRTALSRNYGDFPFRVRRFRPLRHLDRRRPRRQSVRHGGSHAANPGTASRRRPAAAPGSLPRPGEPPEPLRPLPRHAKRPSPRPCGRSGKSVPRSIAPWPAAIPASPIASGFWPSACGWKRRSAIGDGTRRIAECERDCRTRPAGPLRHRALSQSGGTRGGRAIDRRHVAGERA